MENNANKYGFQQSYKDSNKQSITIGVDSWLTLADIQSLTQNKLAVEVSSATPDAMKYSYDFLKECIDQRTPIYGLNTNFGDQVRYLDRYLNNRDEQNLYYESINTRQAHIIKSLACGLGDTLSPDIIRTTMVLRAHCLAQGYSGIHPNVIEAILDFVNTPIIPVVRQYGSIGASGDLIPLATIATAIIGENVDVWYQGEIVRAPIALEKAGLKKFVPHFRDGLAMINGTSFMTAIASLSLYNLHRLFFQMLTAIAMALESMLIISSAYNPLVHQLKKQSGENSVNDFLLNFWQGSLLLADLDEVRLHAHTSDKPMQDCYSLRSVSQGFGPMLENLERAIVWIEREMNSVNDNPIIDAKNKQIHHSANFMGYYVTDSCDILKMNIAQASTWLHALLANMVHPRKNRDLPTNLVEDPDKNNGFRSMQLLAAALAAQNRKLAQCHQAFMLPTEGDNQDVNSLGTHAALDFQESVLNLERLTAILLLASTQALELRGIGKANPRSRAIFEKVREYSAKLVECRPMSEEISAIIDLLKDEQI